MTAGLISPRLRCIKHTICAPGPKKTKQKHFRPSDLSVASSLLRCRCGGRTAESNLPVIFWFWLCSFSSATSARREDERHSDTYRHCHHLYWMTSEALLLLLACDRPFLLPVFLLAAPFYYLQTERRPNGPRDNATLSNPSSLARIAEEVLWSGVIFFLFFLDLFILFCF